MKSRWEVSYRTSEATEDIEFLFNNIAVKEEIIRILSLMVKEKDPRSPKPSSNLIVDELEHDAPHWFRVKKPRYAIRIIFRILIYNGKVLIELKHNEPIPDDTAIPSPIMPRSGDEVEFGCCQSVPSVARYAKLNAVRVKRGAI